MNRRTIFWLWLPLALSFTFMMLEGPTVQAAVARLPEPALSLAAFGLVLGISLIIESPIIMLVSTAIALCTNAQAYRALRRFMIGLNVVLTVVTGVVAWTPLFDLISRQVLGMPPPIVAAGRPALQILLFWTAAIGWRRFYQGILVRHGYSGRVSIGTALRLAASIITAAACVVWGGIGGASVGALTLMVGVAVEAVATHIMAFPVVRDQVLTNVAPNEPPLTQAEIVRFHMPLAGTSLLTLLAQPVTAAALARLAMPRETLAAWPVVFSSLLVLRGWGLALQETTIAQARDARALTPLRQFTMIVAAVTTSAAVLLAMTPLLEIHLHYVIGLAPELHAFVYVGMQIACLLPGLTALASWRRGLMVVNGATSRVYYGMSINLATNCALLALGVFLQLPGVPVAAGALTLASAIEYLYLRRSLPDRRPTAVKPVDELVATPETLPSPQAVLLQAKGQHTD